ncbi:MAG: DUF4956 domain-containing protein [Lachnospiraceae bacterium]|nr:DUF4956 domain-containing protein [Lachnospiraceae bacterium]
MTSLTSIFLTGSFDLISVLIMMAASLLMGISIALLFRHFHPENGDYNIILAILPLIVSLIIMIVNGNLGTSVAILGAFGLIRFRSAPGSASEIGFLFYAMAVGLAAGLGFLTLALLITVFVGLFIFILNKSSLKVNNSPERLLRITIPEDLNYPEVFDDLLGRYTLRSELIQVKTTGMGTMYELSYAVYLKDPNESKAFIDELRCRNGNLGIILGYLQKDRNTL